MTFTFFRNLPIQRKISLAILLTCCSSLSIAAVALFLAQLANFRQNFTRDLEATGEMLGHNTAAAITFKDHTGAQDLLAAVRAKPYILRAAIDLPDGSELARFQSQPAPRAPLGDGIHFTGGYVALNQPVMLAGERIGTLRLLCDYQAEFTRSLRLDMAIFAVVLLASVVLALALSERLQRLISAPIVSLAGTARAVAEKNDYSLRCSRLSQDEVGQLTESFNMMLAKIEEADRSLRQANQSLEHEIEGRKRREEEIEKLHKELMLTSRQAGMAEVATGVLHNVGNVLNSVNVSVNLLNDRLRQSHVGSVGKLSALVDGRRGDLAAFLTSDPKGQRVPELLSRLAAALAEERAELAQEVQTLVRNVEHIKEIVAMQQSYAKVAGVTEDLPLVSLLEDALRLNAGAFSRHGVKVRRQFQETPSVRVDKHKALQILVNLFRNAKYALDAGPPGDKLLTLAVSVNGNLACLRVIDNGVGIAPENLTRIFGHGFTTRRDGHGFGLHSGALAAKEMGGSLQAFSDGQGKGATFTLELPLAPKNPTTPAL